MGNWRGFQYRPPIQSFGDAVDASEWVPGDFHDKQSVGIAWLVWLLAGFQHQAQWAACQREGAAEEEGEQRAC